MDPAFLAGTILRVVALVPILGELMWFVSVVFGLGALLVGIRELAQGAAPSARLADGRA